jgi:tetratricopeptide (TPR) repeat protein
VAAALVLAGCGGEPARPELAGVPLSDELRPYVEAAWRTLEEPDRGDPAVHAEIDRFDALLRLVQVPATRVAAAESLYAWWHAEPQDILLPELLFRFKWQFDFDDELARLRRETSLADTTSAGWAYLESRLAKGRDRQLELVRLAWSRRAALSPLDEAWLTLKLARAERMTGHESASMDRLLSNLQGCRASGGKRLERQMWLEIVCGLLQGGHLDDALHAACVLEALAVAVGAGNGEPYPPIQFRTLKADVLAARREAVPALSLLEEVVDESLAAGMYLPATNCLNNAAILTGVLGDDKAGLAYLRRSFACIHADGDSINAPRILMNIARRMRRQGQLDSCLVYQRRAERWIERFPDPENVARMPLMQAEYYAQIGEYAVVDSLLAAAAGRAENYVSRTQAAELFLRLMEEGVERGRPDQAYRALSAIDTLRGRMGSFVADRHVAFDQDLYAAEFLGRRGQFAQAVEALARAEAALDRRDDQRRRWQLARARGDLARRRGDPRTSAAAYEECLQRAVALGDVDREATSRFLVGAALLEQGDSAGARNVLPSEQGEFGGRFRTRLSALLYRGLADWREGMYEEALAGLDRARDLLTPGSPPDLAARIHLTRGRVLEAAGRRDEARAARDEVERLLLVGGADGADGGTEELGFLQSGLRREYAEAELAALTAEHPTVSGRAARKALLGTARILPHWHALDDGSPDYTEIVFFAGVGSVYRWVIGGRAFRLERLSGVQEVSAALGPVLADLTHPGRPQPAAGLSDLCALIGGPPSEWDGRTALRIVPDGVLHDVPWAVLPWRADGSMWLDRGALLILDAPDLAAATPDVRAASERLLAVGVDGNAAADAAGLAKLRHAEREAREVSTLWPVGAADLRVGGEAIWSRLAAGGLAGYDVIHVASHAVAYRGDADRATLLLAGDDAPVTAEGIGELTLDADLVYLSCCEAADGGSSGAARAGLARAFLAAGVRRVVAPTQPVDDAASRELALRFHGHRLDGLEAAAAMRRAQLELRDGGSDRAHPFYWAFQQVLARR